MAVPEFCAHSSKWLTMAQDLSETTLSTPTKSTTGTDPGYRILKEPRLAL